MTEEPMASIENGFKFRIVFFMTICAFIALCTVPLAANALPSFPGAEGFGSTTVGGRGGKVLFVTNLNASGTGSLRAAMTASGPRIIVFRVGGTINLSGSGDINVSNPYMTIAGQTAPGDGILIRGGAINISTHDVIIRGLRLRTNGADSMNNFSGAYNIIWDHNSMSWSTDTVAGNWYNPHDITFSWNIIAEGLTTGEHSAGMLVGGYNDCTEPGYNITMHHNLLAHNMQRSPLIKMRIGSPEFINNVVYNWQATGTTTFSEAYIAKNHYIAGANTASGVNAVEVKNGGECPSLQAASVMVSHNIGPGRLTDTGDDWLIVKGGSSTYRTNSLPFALSGVTEDDVGDVKAKVLGGAGASYPAWDIADTRIISDVKNVTGSAKSAPPAWPSLASGTAPTDTDNDGMPDSWETAHGLNPNSSADGNLDLDGDGYTNIEEYINSLIPTVATSSPPPPPPPPPPSSPPPPPPAALTPNAPTNLQIQ
jgi:pectate lyase